MKAKAFLAPALALAAGVAGFFIRQRELRTGFDLDGLNIPSPDATVLVLLSVAAVLLALLWGLTRRAAPGWAEVYGGHSKLGPLRLASALGLLGGAVVNLSMSQSTFFSLVAVLGIGAGICQAAADVLLLQGKKPLALAELLPVVYLVCLLIYYFRSWSIDPVVLDYCFRLFAMISIMLCAFARAGYAFDQGRRKSLAVFSAASVFFCVLSLADGQIGQMLLFAACALRGLTDLYCAAAVEA